MKPGGASRLKMNASQRLSRHSAVNAENGLRELLMQKWSPSLQITVSKTTTVTSLQMAQWCEKQNLDGHLLPVSVDLLMRKALVLQN